MEGELGVEGSPRPPLEYLRYARHCPELVEEGRALRLGEGVESTRTRVEEMESHRRPV